MRALIIGNGQILDTGIIRQNLNENDIIICCDGGTRYAFEEGVLPHYILGDLDSSSGEIIQFFELKDVIFKKFPEKKDETDMELCIDFAISLGVTEILIFGAIGTRFDHSLANANILMQALNSNIFAKIINENNEITLIDNEIEIIGEKGDLISLLPLSTNVTGVTTEGLEYPLNDYTMEIGKALGISNVMLYEKAKISIKNGYLFVINRQNLNENDIIICCDGGTRYAFEEGVLPHYILGDLDSSSGEIIQFFELKDVIFKKFPEKKDETDMELCIDFAISLGVTEILIFGAIGTRFDHSLANANILMQALNSNIFAKIINENNEITLIDNEIEIIGEKGDLISLLPLSTNVTGVTTEGLEYPLNDYTMEIGKALGISNVMLYEKAKISIKNGYLFVIKARD